MAAGDTYYKHNAFLDHLRKGYHDFSSEVTADITAYLTNTIPLATNSVLADLTSPVTANLSSQVFAAPTTNGMTGSQWIYKLPTLVITASADSIPAFQYVGLYNPSSTTVADALICWWDYEAAVNLNTDDTFTISFALNTWTLG